MRRIEVLDNLHLQFPGRDEEFDLGIEVGALSVMLALGERIVRRSVSGAAVEQLRPIAERFGYTVVSTPGRNGLWDVCFTHASMGRPKLRIV